VSESKKPAEQDEPPDAFERFQKLARALFRVDKRDVPKHEPKKREPRSSALPNH
jgi:hypothetical protein